MTKEVKLRRGTTAQHAAFTGAVGEVTVDTDKNTLVVHDGVTPGGHPVPRMTTKFDAVLYAANWGADCRNLFDEVWEQGVISATTGVPSASAYAIRSVNNIPVTGGNTYNFTHQSILGSSYVIWYGASGYISYTNINVVSSTTAPSGATYCKITMTNGTTAFTPANARPFMFAEGSTVKPWEPQDRGYHLKATDYSDISDITADTNIAIEEPRLADTTSVKLRVLRSAKLTAGFQTAATEIVLIASGVVPGIDVPIRVFLKGDM